MLGRDHATWGEFTLIESGAGRTVNALSVGADADSPSMASKGSQNFPNEDALLSIDEGPRTLLAVADAHHGFEASHDLLRAVALGAARIPATLEELEKLIGRLEGTGKNDESASTLLVAVYDRSVQAGFGLSFGDSSLVSVGAEGAHVINVRRPQYLSLRGSHRIHAEDGHGFRFFSAPGRLVVAFTDGVNECHYRSPATSITPAHLASLFTETDADPVGYTERLMNLALTGVNGHPGGQDNIALVVTATASEPIR